MQNWQIKEKEKGGTVENKKRGYKILQQSFKCF